MPDSLSWVRPAGRNAQQNNHHNTHHETKEAPKTKQKYLLHTSRPSTTTNRKQTTAREARRMRPMGWTKAGTPSSAAETSGSTHVKQNKTKERRTDTLPFYPHSRHGNRNNSSPPALACAHHRQGAPLPPFPVRTTSAPKNIFFSLTPVLHKI